MPGRPRVRKKREIVDRSARRFERGVDPAFLDDATAIVTAHILAICGGTPSAVTRAGTPPAGVKTIDYDPALSATLRWFITISVMPHWSAAFIG